MAGRTTLALAGVAIGSMAVAAEALDAAHGAWSSSSGGESCWISTAALSGDGTDLTIWKGRTDFPILVVINNPGWNEAPGRWSKDGWGMADLRFSAVDPQRVEAARVGPGIAIANYAETEGLTIVVLGLLDEAEIGGWMEIAVAGAPALGRFSARGFPAAIDRLKACTEAM